MKIRPDYAEAHNNLGSALAGRGRLDEAMAHFRKALEIQPDSAEAHSNLGIALAAGGRLDEAVEHFRKALEIQPDSAEAHYNLGNALARQGRLDEALAATRTALELALRQDKKALADALRTRIACSKPRGVSPAMNGSSNTARRRYALGHAAGGGADRLGHGRRLQRQSWRPFHLRRRPVDPRQPDDPPALAHRRRALPAEAAAKRSPAGRC